MPHRPPPLRGLTFKLAVFYIALSLPALVLIELTIVAFEFRELFAAVDAGRLATMAEHAAKDIGKHWRDPPPSANELATRGEALVLQLERPQGGLAPEASYVMLELSSSPLAVSVYDRGQQLLARAPAESWQAQPPAPADPAWERAASGITQVLPGSETPERVRRLLVPVPDTAGVVKGFLLIELRVPQPWRRLLGEVSYEWPILFTYLLVFSLASAFFLVRWVTRRLNIIARAAHAWSDGDFSTLIPDDSKDELGRLSFDLNRMAQQLKTLMRTQADLASLQERQRIARDLHDTVKQKAFALNLQIGAARRLLGRPDHPAVLRLDESARLISDIQRELAQVLDELREERPPGGFLAPRLRELAERWARMNGLEVEIQLDEHVPDDAVRGEALLRIAEEALSNVLRHSGATKVVVDLRRQADQITLRIADNGIGGADGGSGMGLGNMRERAERLPEGRFELTSAPGAGTEVRVTCKSGAAPV
ncbi:HAMP domain-containing sensor histidine kinase [Tahibacter amnicola]|uniref:HAMP domain-containing protein n=1 Tax=Tahibacter amnicola TaxID=2976241 RepID=A0ABY6BLK0_9GAMM|nr:HAMP domain-containing protein [Tahibacter amnicola]UXI69446.1 HAMP domain-containing protein [Tahibacter amnicola]